MKTAKNIKKSIIFQQNYIKKDKQGNIIILYTINKIRIRNLNNPMSWGKVYYYPTIEGKRISNTNFARKYDAVNRATR